MSELSSREALSHRIPRSDFEIHNCRCRREARLPNLSGLCLSSNLHCQKTLSERRTGDRSGLFSLCFRLNDHRSVPFPLPLAHFRKTKAAIKMHTFLDLRGAIPTFISLTTGKVHDVNILDILPLEKDAVIAMDRGYVDFTRLYAVNLFPAFFVIRAKSNFRCRRLNSQKVDKTLGLRSDQHIVLTTKKSRAAYPEALRRVSYVDLDTDKSFVYLTNIFTVSAI